MDEVTDWFNAIHWLQAEPQFDPARLGLWGSSFSGGLVVYVAEHEARVKAIHPGGRHVWPRYDRQRSRAPQDL